MKYDDNSKMPFGEHKGKALVNVPASYLLYLYEQPWLRGPVKEYIKENFATISTQAKRGDK